MGKYRKKPVVIEAIQFDGSKESAKEIMAWMKNYDKDDSWVFNHATIQMPTLEGLMIANPKDWIIKGIKDEFYPCKPDIFEETYDLVEE
jgi:hypothetical protein